MNDIPTDDQLRAIAERIQHGSTVLRSWRLEGGVSAQVTAVELAMPEGGSRRIVIRRHGEIDKGHNPDIALDEFRLLQAVHDAGLAVPAPLDVEAAGEIFGEPCLVVAFVDGSTDIPPEAVPSAIEQMAGYLACLHTLTYDRHGVDFLPRLDDPVGRTLHSLPDTSDTARIRETLARHGTTASRNAPTLLHGDFWPGNILWKDGQIAAVLDWEDAAIGDPVADLAGSRLELLWMFGPDEMDAFTAHYLAHSAIDLADLPLWELASASGAAAQMSNWGLAPDTEAKMREKAWWLMERARHRLEAERSG